MTKRPSVDQRRLPLVVILLALAGGLTADPVQAQQPETTITCDEAAEPQRLTYGDSTADCAIDPVTDSDIFVLTGADGDLVRVNMQALVPRFDPRIEIRDALGKLIADESCQGGVPPFEGGACSFSFEIAFTIPGDTRLIISDFQTNEPGSYQLTVENLTTPSVISQVFYGFSVKNEINPATDMDFYSFSALSGNDVRFQMAALVPRFDPRIEIWDPDGQIVINEKCQGGVPPFQGGACSFLVDYRFENDGIYLLGIGDAGNDEPGSYEFALQCLSGGCPPKLPDLSLRSVGTFRPGRRDRGIEIVGLFGLKGRDSGGNL